MNLWRWIVPHVPRRDLPIVGAVSLAGGLIAGIYGALHDQVTYSISPEYFTQLKFHQFHYLNYGQSSRLFAGMIGFLASWWVGLFAAWLLARSILPGAPRGDALRKIAIGFGIVLGCTVACGALDYGYGIWRGPDADYTAWRGILTELTVRDAHAFTHVAYIHNGGYLGAFIGLLVAWFSLTRIAHRGARLFFGWKSERMRLYLTLIVDITTL